MSRRFAVLSAWLGLAGLAAAQRPAPRLVFGGDVMLARQVAAELRARPGQAWLKLAPFLRGATLAAANFEGAVGPASQCATAARLPDGNANLSPCFAVAPAALAGLHAAGFTAFSIANNHSRDLGAAGVAETERRLATDDLTALDWKDSPIFFRFGGTEVAIVAVTLVPARDGSHQKLPSPALAQRLRLARALANLVIVDIHWGTELHDWPSAAQQAQARWLIAQGADLIIGAHPHVIEAPACVAGRPVFYSLGNLLFDQRYPETRTGMLADCRLRADGLACRAERAGPPPGSFFPAPLGEDAAANRTLAACPAPLHATLGDSSWHLLPGPAPPGERSLRAVAPDGSVLWRTRPTALLSAAMAPFTPGAAPYLFTLERHPSALDGLDAPRPYVYRLGPGGPVARWRGSALAWPLVDARLLPGAPGILCALHTQGSFLIPGPQNAGYRYAAYRWDGFGFAGDHDPAIEARCHALMRPEAP